MRAQNVYTSIACNRTTDVADWGNNGLIVFGASNAIAILDPNFEGKSAKIMQTYVKHTKKVKAVQWIRELNGEMEKYVISGGDDDLGILWDIHDWENPVAYTLEGHSSGLEAVTGMKHPKGHWLLGTSSTDSTVRLWQFNGSECKCVQNISLNSGFCFSLRFTTLPKSEETLLAFSTDDEIISLWVTNEDDAANEQYRLAHKLPGHEDWVTSLDSINYEGDLLLASASQDNFIRLWRIAPRTEEQVRNNTVDIFNVMDEASGEIRVEEKILQLATNSWYAVGLESVLCGHDGWVHSVQWHQSDKHGIRLLSASIDKSIIIWAPGEDGIWMEQVRLGEVGGNSLGFFGAKFSHDGNSILGHSFHGGFHIWRQSDVDWTPSVVVSGHYNEVRDLGWEPSGAYLMTVSADQTTRVHATWQNVGTWHEIARPQVHGYDNQALAVLSRYKFASGAEEKIARAFQAPANFVENFRRITGLTDDEEGNALLATLPKGASVPSLGLSNKAVYDIDETSSELKHVKDEYPENYFVPMALDTPPQEEALMQNTLWPEMQKLYGHGYELYALAASPDGQLLASSCRATNAQHAQIILWNTSNWKQVQKLAAHQLTVTQMRFSPNGHFLLSVSRDRRWALFERAPIDGGDGQFTLIATTDKTNGIHGRIIWTCDWSHDSVFFATASREGKMAIWTRSTEAAPTTDTSSLKGWHAVHTLELKNISITAVAFACDLLSEGAYVLALGTEIGLVNVYRFKSVCHLLITLDRNHAHHLTVRKLQFRPQSADKAIQLASCGDDCIVRIYELNI